jgi:hypothetical protein
MTLYHCRLINFHQRKLHRLVVTSLVADGHGRAQPMQWKFHPMLLQSSSVVALTFIDGCW